MQIRWRNLLLLSLILALVVITLVRRVEWELRLERFRELIDGCPGDLQPIDLLFSGLLFIGFLAAVHLLARRFHDR